DIKVCDVTIDTQYRFISCVVMSEGRKYKFLALYAPAGSSRNQWWEKNYKILEGKEVILGDFNFVMDQTRDRNKPSTDLGKANMELVKPILDKYQDAAVVTNNLTFTYRDISRLDRVYFNSKALSVVKYRIRMNHLADDHHMIRVKLEPPQYKPPFWRFKSYLMVNEHLKGTVKNELALVCGGEWSQHKANVRKALIRWEKKTLKKRRKNYYIAKSLAKRYPKSANRIKWKASIEAWSKLHEKAKVMWAAAVETVAHERPSGFVTRKLAAKRNKSAINAVKDPVTGAVVEEPEDIVKAVESFYSNLYKFKSTNAK
ncbi:MAG: hypothetical protein NXI00_22845, partial [Cytophagales bacterium]|nr:hypothetical protein [Cytophagales bacterium]